MKVLECSSAGDKRFSAFYAKVVFNGVLDTIERHYQSVKRNASDKPCRKSERVAYIIIDNVRYSPELLTPLYRYLWYKYLHANPELVKYASQFDAFNDKFRGKCVNCQADCVKAYVNKDQGFYNCIRPFIKNKEMFYNARY